MKAIRNCLLSVFVFVLLGLAFVYSGLYKVGADEEHSRLTYWLLETMREKSVERSARKVEVPDLSSPEMLLSGGADYNDMCSNCHLQPGVIESDMSLGLYPRSPNLAISLDERGRRGNHKSDENDTARRNFWIIKHGIKASGMPAWGTTHSDERIWAMVAFLNKLPSLSTVQYQILTARQESETDSHH